MRRTDGLALAWKARPVIGRDEGDRRVVQVFVAAERRIIPACGEPGVGKIAMARDWRGDFPGRCTGDSEEQSGVVRFILER